MYKRRMLKIGVISLAIVAMIFTMVPQIGLADSPPGESSAMYPTKTPPSEPPKAPSSEPSEIRPDKVQVTVHESDAGILATSYMFYIAYDPYKSGTSAKGAARTSTNWIPFVWKHVYADAWLWKWVVDEWVLVAHAGGYVICPPRCEITVTATYTNAESAYYITTSRHEVWADNQPLHYATDESDYVWLSY